MNTTPSPIRVGVIGLGFMGATHVAAYRSAACDGFDCALVAVCDPKAHRRRGELGDVGGNIDTGDKSGLAFDPAVVRGFEKPDDLIADPNIDLISICTRTDSHVDLCVRALRAGKHVLVEKPVSLKSNEIRNVERAAREAKRVCMPAMCIRYWPGWSWVKDRIDDGSLGRVVSATSHRLAPVPAWGRFADPAVTGGALIDLHIHDADFMRWCFGAPRAVTSTGHVDHVTTIYHYDEGRGPAHVVAEGGWDHASGFPYRMRFVVVFEKGTADYELMNKPRLTLCRDGRSEPIELGDLLGYDVQVRALVAALTGRRGPALATLSEAADVTEMLDAEAESIRTRQTVPLAR